MAIRVTMRIFSCRRNPVREIKGTDEAALVRSLTNLPVARPALEGSKAPRIGGLGFRGFLIEPVSSTGPGSAAALSSWVSLYGGVAEYAHGPNRVDANRVAEYDLLNIFLRDLEPDIAVLARKEAQDLYGEPNCRRSPAGTGSLPGRKAYNVSPWHVSGVISRNNCYNYANNERFTTGDAAIPGAGGGQPRASGTCAQWKTAVRADLLINLAEPIPAGALPSQGWPVALFRKPDGSDVHFYRQDKTGRWSHKPGGWPVRACDESGAPIINIRNVNALDYQFCGLFETDDNALIASN